MAPPSPKTQRQIALRPSEPRVPPIVRKAIELLDEKAVKTEGLFRISGSKARILEVSKSSVCVKNESLMLCVGGLVARSMFLVGNVRLVLLGTGGRGKGGCFENFSLLSFHKCKACCVHHRIPDPWSFTLSIATTLYTLHFRLLLLYTLTRTHTHAHTGVVMCHVFT